MERTLEDIRGDLSAQAQEVYALENIYGPENIKSHHDGCDLNVELYVPSVEGPHVTLKVKIPNTYPSLSPPSAHVSAPFLSDGTVRWAHNELEKLYRPGVKENILFTWVEWIKDTEEMRPPGKKQAEETGRYIALGRMDADNLKGLSLTSHKEPEDLSEDLSEEKAVCPEHGTEINVSVRPGARIIHGEPFTERKSTFQAHLAPATSLHEVKMLMDALMENNKVQKATHNIMAYRIQSNNGSWIQDCDDDGESAAGARLLHLLQMTDTRNVLVVVSRWFGGVMLGPARFTHINNAARMLLAKNGYISTDYPKTRRKGR